MSPLAADGSGGGGRSTEAEMRESQTGESLRLGRSMRRTWTQKRETRQVDVERNSAGKVQGDVIAVLRSVGDTFDLVSRCV